MAYVEWLSETGWRQRSHDELTRHCGVICLEKQMLRGHELPGSKHKVYKRARVLLPEDAKSFNAGISAQGAQLALLDHTFLPIDLTSSMALPSSSTRKRRQAQKHMHLSYSSGYSVIGLYVG